METVVLRSSHACCVGGLLAALVSAAPMVRSHSAFLRECDSSNTIVAYRLNPEQEAQFGGTAGNVITFFTSWDSVRSLATAKLDWLDTDTGVGHASSGPEDINVRLRTAYGAGGLYLWFSRQDDYVCGYEILPAEWLWLYFEPRSADSLYRYLSTNGSLGENQLTCRTLRLARGFSAIVEPLQHLYICPSDTIVQQQCSLPWTLANTKRYFDDGQAEAESRIAIKTLLWQDTGKYTVQAVHVPWSRYGVGGVPSPHKGDRLAFTFSSQDCDNLLEFQGWRNRADPLTIGVDSATGDTASVDCWGDILFSEPLDSAVARAGVVRQPGRGRHAQALAMSAGAEYFSVTGRKIDVVGSSYSSQHARGLVLVRTGENGALGRKLVLGQ